MFAKIIFILNIIIQVPECRPQGFGVHAAPGQEAGLAAELLGRSSGQNSEAKAAVPLQDGSSPYGSPSVIRRLPARQSPYSAAPRFIAHLEKPLSLTCLTISTGLEAARRGQPTNRRRSQLTGRRRSSPPNSRSRPEGGLQMPGMAGADAESVTGGLSFVGGTYSTQIEGVGALAGVYEDTPGLSDHDARRLSAGDCLEAMPGRARRQVCPGHGRGDPVAVDHAQLVVEPAS